MVEHLRNSYFFFSSRLQCEKELEQIIARTPFVMHYGKVRVEPIFIKVVISGKYINLNKITKI